MVIGSEKVGLKEIEREIMRNKDIRKIEIFGKVYCSLADVRSHFIGPKQLNKTQRSLMNKKGILVRIIGKDKCKWYIPETMISDFIEIVL